MFQAPVRSSLLRSLRCGFVVLAALCAGCHATSESAQLDQDAQPVQSAIKSPLLVYPIPNAVKDSPWVVQVGNLFVPIESSGGIDYARFQDTEDVPVAVTVTLSGKQPADFKIAPASIRMEQHGNSVILDVPTDGYLRLIASRGSKDLTPLYLFRELDSYSPFRAGSGRQRPRVNIEAPPPGTDPAHHTAKIQELLDLASVNAGSALVVMPGIHPIEELVFKNDVTIYFKPGAVWKCVSDPMKWKNHVLLDMQGARNITLAGYGVIKFEPDHAFPHTGPDEPLIAIRDATNIRIQNLVLCGGHDVCVENSSHVVLDHLRLIGALQGIVPQSSTDVELTNLVMMQKN